MVPSAPSPRLASFSPSPRLDDFYLLNLSHVGSHPLSPSPRHESSCPLSCPKLLLSPLDWLPLESSLPLFLHGHQRNPFNANVIMSHLCLLTALSMGCEAAGLASTVAHLLCRPPPPAYAPFPQQPHSSALAMPLPTTGLLALPSPLPGMFFLFLFPGEFLLHF